MAPKARGDDLERANAGRTAQGHRGPGMGPSGYVPADSQGNFLSMQDEDALDAGQVRVDCDELEYDPSERRPGGPIAEAVRAAGAQVRQLKWAIPLLSFLVALLLQSMGLVVATHNYVSRPVGLGKLNTTHLHPDALDPDAWRNGQASNHSITLDKALLPRDNFAVHLFGPPSHRTKLVVDFIVAVIPWAWLAIVLRSRNLRLWTRTLLAGSILALLKCLLAWVTLVPDPAGWQACLERLPYRMVTNSQQGVAGMVDSRGIGILGSTRYILTLWVEEVILGMSWQHDFVCPSSLSGPSSWCTLFALGLFDALRSYVRKMKPFFRSLFHIGSAVVLTTVVLVDGLLDLAAHQQYTADVIVAVLVTTLVYGSPVVAIIADFFMLRGLGAYESMDGCDVGDVIVPPCCFPFCFVHGRYFLFTRSAEATEESFQEQQKAARVMEQIRQERANASRRFEELEGQLRALRAPPQAKDLAAAERRFNEQVAVLREAHEGRVARQLEQGRLALEAEVERNAQKEEEEKQQYQRFHELQQMIYDEREKLDKEVMALEDAAKAAEAAAQESLEELTEKRRSVEELRRSLKKLEEVAPESPAAAAAQPAEEAACGLEQEVPAAEEVSVKQEIPALQLTGVADAAHEMEREVSAAEEASAAEPQMPAVVRAPKVPANASSKSPSGGPNRSRARAFVASTSPPSQPASARDAKGAAAGQQEAPAEQQESALPLCDARPWYLLPSVQPSVFLPLGTSSEEDDTPNLQPAESPQQSSERGAS